MEMYFRHEKAKQFSESRHMRDRRRMEWVSHSMVLHFRHFSATSTSPQKGRNAWPRKKPKNSSRRFVLLLPAAPQEAAMGTRRSGIQAPKCSVSLRPKVTRLNLPFCCKL